MNSTLTDEAKMRLALQQAELAAQAGEVPVGAVVFKEGLLIASGRNAPIADCDPTAHAEMVALRQAAQVLGNYRLDGCELFVTLEPCAMCSGAILQSRLSRLVFGAAEPKTGAAGSVINLFDNPALNHQTQVQGGLMAYECGHRMQQFFQTRRSTQAEDKKLLHALREDALRTPEACFAQIPDYPWSANYLSDLPALNGLRLHYLDAGPHDATLTYLCLHSNPAWSYVYRKMIPVFTRAGYRVVAPDLIGFGKSDKPKKGTAHSFGWHQQMLLEFVARLDLRNIVLVLQGWEDLLGLALPAASAERYTGLLLTGQTEQAPEDYAAYSAPFPDTGHRAAIRAFPAMLAGHSEVGESAVARDLKAFWQDQWTGMTLQPRDLQMSRARQAAAVQEHEQEGDVFIATTAVQFFKASMRS